VERTDEGERDVRPAFTLTVEAGLRALRASPLIGDRFEDKVDHELHLPEGERPQGNEAP
jgi:hypothetical protein